MTPFKDTGFPEWESDVSLCDDMMVEYCRERRITSKNIFHFGTGLHHRLGVECTTEELSNEVLGVTISTNEHKEYVRLITDNPKLNRYYRILFADIYCLTPRSLPKFDIVYLPHIGEYQDRTEKDIRLHSDRSLIQMFLEKLNHNGMLIFYTKSHGWGVGRDIVNKLKETRQIIKYDTYKDLVSYKLVRN